MKKIVLFSSLGLIVLVALGVFVMGIGYQNDEVRLVNEFKAQEKKIEATHDNLWKILTEKAGVAKEYAAQFDSIYSHIMSERYENNDKVIFNWITESNPNFSDDLYKEVSIAIEVQRKQFLASQEKIIDIVREHNNMLDVIPAKWFIGGRERLEWEVISSAKSKDVMNTRMDDDLKLWNK